jgi:hypothetical protein
MTKPERDEADETEPPEATDPLVVALAPLVETICDLTAEGSQERKAALTIALGLPGRIRAAVAKPRMH